MTEQTPDQTPEQPDITVAGPWETAAQPDAPGTSDAPEAEGDWPTEVVEEIRSAEAAQQRSLCDIPEGDLPDELAEALELRVEVNLAQYDGGEVRRVGSTDPRVRELEAPWTHKARRATGA